MNVVAIVVTYNPVLNDLDRLCAILVSADFKVIVIDNSEVSGVVGRAPINGCHCVSLAGNAGIARAQNIGIMMALDLGADFIAFFDQDSMLDSASLTRLVSTLVPGECGVAAPLCVDRASGMELPSALIGSWGKASKVYSEGRADPYAVELVVSSGCVVSAVTFSVVGLMDEDFFIDYVDLEWCFRCRGAKVPIIVVPSVVMSHSIGQRAIHLGFMGITIHSAQRSYYKVRNCFLLFRKESIPVLFALNEVVSALAQSIVVLLIQTGRLGYLSSIIFGVVDGLRGATGKRKTRCA